MIVRPTLFHSIIEIFGTIMVKFKEWNVVSGSNGVFI